MDNQHCHSCHAPGDFSHHGDLCLGCIHMSVDIRSMGYHISMETPPAWYIEDYNNDMTLICDAPRQPFKLYIVESPDTITLPTIESVVTYFDERRSTSQE